MVGRYSTGGDQIPFIHIYSTSSDGRSVALPRSRMICKHISKSTVWWAVHPRSSKQHPGPGWSWYVGVPQWRYMLRRHAPETLRGATLQRKFEKGEMVCLDVQVCLASFGLFCLLLMVGFLHERVSNISRLKVFWGEFRGSNPFTGDTWTLGVWGFLAPCPLRTCVVFIMSISWLVPRLCCERR